MRDFTLEDGFTLSEILDKTGLQLDLNAFADAAKQDKDKQAYLGGQLVLSIIKKMHLAKDAIVKLMADMSGEPVDDVKKWGIGKIKTFFADMLKQGGIRDFFN